MHYLDENLKFSVSYVMCAYALGAYMHVRRTVRFMAWVSFRRCDPSFSCLKIRQRAGLREGSARTRVRGEIKGGGATIDDVY